MSEYRRVEESWASYDKDPRNEQSILPLHPADMQSIIGNWTYLGSLNAAEIHCLLYECVRLQRTSPERERCARLVENSTFDYIEVPGSGAFVEEARTKERIAREIREGK